jgi:hypothetical protein
MSRNRVRDVPRIPYNTSTALVQPYGRMRMCEEQKARQKSELRTQRKRLVITTTQLQGVWCVACVSPSLDSYNKKCLSPERSNAAAGFGDSILPDTPSKDMARDDYHRRRGARNNETIRHLFSIRHFDEAARMIQAEIEQVRADLEQGGHAASRQFIPEAGGYWHRITPVPIRCISEGRSPDVPPNAFEIYPYLLELDSITCFPCTSERISCSGAPKSASTVSSTPEDECTVTPTAHGPTNSNLLSSNIRSHQVFMTVITTITHKYNLAMALICSSTMSSVPSIQLQAAASSIRCSLKLLSILRADILKASWRSELTIEHRLYRLTVINQLRLAALNNLAYVYSMWGQQAYVNACLEAITVELKIRSHLADGIYLRYQRNLSAMAAKPVVVVSTLTTVESSVAMTHQGEPHVCKDGHAQQAEEADGERRLHEMAMLRTLLVQFEPEGDNDASFHGILTLYYNLQYIHPAGSTPISGAPTA